MVLFRTLTKRTWAAFVVTILIVTVFSLANTANQGVQIVFIWFFWLALLGVLMRYGLLAAAVAFFLHSPVSHGMMTADLGSWYGTYALGAVLLLLGVALGSFAPVSSFPFSWMSTARRRVFTCP